MQLESKAVLVGRRFPQFLMSFSLMIIFVLICGILWYPVVRSTYSSEINYNEGWNSYYATYASLGKALYASESHYIGLNYPPLSFHLVGLVGKLLGDVTRAGRWISLLSLAATAVGVALIVYQGSK